jgi:hypothetical protein
MEVRIDGGATVVVDQKKGACIDGLALDGKHIMWTPGETARFRFEPGQTVLELRYAPFYGHVHLETPPWLARKSAGMTTCDACALTVHGPKKPKKDAPADPHPSPLPKTGEGTGKTGQ